MQGLDLITFEDLYSKNIEVTDIHAERQKWVKGVTYSNGSHRRINGIILLNGCNGIYTDLNENGTSFFASQNSIVCLPEGSNYTIFNNDCGLSNQDAYLIEFHIKEDDKLYTFSPHPFLITTPFSSALSHAIKEVVRRYEEPIKSPVNILSSVYEVLTILGKGNSKALSRDYSAIAQGIKIIERDPFNDISLEEIAAMCNISSAGFRRNFKKYLGESPVQYRTKLKIKAMQYMLEHSNVTVEEMSELLGINNATYVYKMFKKSVGASPKEYRNRFKNNF